MPKQYTFLTKFANWNDRIFNSLFNPFLPAKTKKPKQYQQPTGAVELIDYPPDAKPTVKQLEQQAAKDSIVYQNANRKYLDKYMFNFDLPRLRREQLHNRLTQLKANMQNSKEALSQYNANMANAIPVPNDVIAKKR